MQDTSAKPRECEPLEQEFVTSLLERYRRALIGYFRRRVHDLGEAEDLAQEVFVRILSRGDVAAIADVRAYLFEVALSVLVDRARRDKVRHKATHQSFDPEGHGAEDFASDRIHLGKEALGRATAALLELPERTRIIFVLRRLEGMKYSEIAHKLGISVSAVEKQMLRAMSYLTERMRDS
jgi:RNA polymerase sigma factor (sigma-70 family)